MIDYERRLIEAMYIAREAGSIITRPDNVINVHSKGKNDLVSDMDLLSESTIKKHLSANFPEDAFIGEEGGYSRVDNPEGIWVVDPIDGSADFVHGMQLWSISIGYMVNGVIMLGVVYCPGTGELFHAIKGRGSYCNDKPIHVSSLDDMEQAITISSPPIRHLELTDIWFRIMRSIFAKSSDFREFGSAALHLCYVASGKVDGFFEFHLKLHDICAGVLIVEEAGGKVEGIEINEKYLETGNIITANFLLHDRYLEIIRQEWNKQ